MMFEGLLPIGTVVLLKNSTKKLMIIGLCQAEADDPDSIWDYCGCVFPEGYLGPEKMYMFNGDQIEQVFALGYQDQEQMKFKKYADEALEKIREKEKKPEG
jgi:hypothetical protein